MSKPKRPPLVKRLKDRFKANPRINLVDMEIPLSNGGPVPKLKDVLEEGQVDNKYYLDHDKVKKVIEKVDFSKTLVSVKESKEERNAKTDSDSPSDSL